MRCERTSKMQRQNFKYSSRASPRRRIGRLFPIGKFVPDAKRLWEIPGDSANQDSAAFPGRMLFACHRQPVLPLETSIQKVPCIELYGGLRGPCLQHAPAVRLVHLCRLFELRACFVNHEIVVIAMCHANQVVLGIYPVPNGRRLSKVQRRSGYGAYLTRRNQLRVARSKARSK